MKKILMFGTMVVALFAIVGLNCTQPTNTGGTVVTFNSSIASGISDATIDKITTIHYKCNIEGSNTATVSGDHSVTTQEKTDYKASGNVKITVSMDDGTYSMLVSARDASGTPLCNWVKLPSLPVTISGSKTIDVVLDGPYGTVDIGWNN